MIAENAIGAVANAVPCNVMHDGHMWVTVTPHLLRTIADAMEALRASFKEPARSIVVNIATAETRCGGLPDVILVWPFES